MTHKYHAQKTTIDDITFDSKAESRRYCELKLLERAELIQRLVLQPTFELQPKFTKNSKKYREINYIADFQYWDVELKQTVVEDVKGFATKEFKIKQKMFEAKYPDLTLKIVD